MEEIPPQNVQIETVRLELGNQLRRAAELKGIIEKLEVETDLNKNELKGLNEIILKTLDLLDLDSIKAHGLLFFKENRTSVTTPKTDEDKKLLFDFLESKGMFLQIASVNSATLNSLYKSLEAEALEAGMLEFKIPGVPEPTTYINLKIRKA